MSAKQTPDLARVVTVIHGQVQGVAVTLLSFRLPTDGADSTLSLVHLLVPFGGDPKALPGSNLVLSLLALQVVGPLLATFVGVPAVTRLALPTRTTGSGIEVELAERLVLFAARTPPRLSDTLRRHSMMPSIRNADTSIRCDWGCSACRSWSSPYPSIGGGWDIRSWDMDRCWFGTSRKNHIAPPGKSCGGDRRTR